MVLFIQSIWLYHLNSVCNLNIHNLSGLYCQHNCQRRISYDIAVETKIIEGTLLP